MPASYLTTVGTHTVRGQIVDKDGGATTYTATVTVTPSAVPGSISGIVFNDINGNGVYDTSSSGSEPGLGADLYLDLDNSGTLNGNETLVYTDNAGHFTFSNLAPGTYTVRLFSQFSNFRQTTPATGPLYVTVASGQAVTGQNFGFQSTATTGAIFGPVFSGPSGVTVYIDANNNGQLDPGELATTATYDSGNEQDFSFSNVPVGTYCIRQVLSSNYVQEIPFDAAPVVTVYPNATGSAVFWDTQKSFTGNITGTVTNGQPGETIYVDVDGNKQFTGEPFATLGSNGTYTIQNTYAGTYTLYQILTGGYSQLSPASNAGVTVNVPQGGTVTASTFADTSLSGAPGSVSGTVSGAPGGTAVFLDVNGDGVIDDGELLTATSFNGTFTFANVPVGSYVLQQLVPSGYTQMSPSGNAGIAITVTAGAKLTGENFVDATITSGSISGAVFNDANGNAKFDSTEAGLAGITVYNDANNNSLLDPGELSTLTLSDGSYSFTGLAAGNYKIRAVLPSGSKQTTPASNYGFTIALRRTKLLPVTTSDRRRSSLPAAWPAPSATLLLARPYSSTPTTMVRSTAVSCRRPRRRPGPTASPACRRVVRAAAGAGDGLHANDAGRQRRPCRHRRGGRRAHRENFVDTKTVAAGGSVSGTVTGGLAGETVYLDTNNNSKFDAGEPSTTTTATGTYSITNAPAGATIVRQVLPSGYTQVTPSGGLGIHVTVTSGGSLANENFADKAPVTTGSISGTITGGLAGTSVYLDANKNGVLDSGELSMTTTSTGTFSFTGVPAGSYVLRQVLTGGYTQTSPAGNAGLAVTVTAGGSLTGQNFTDAAPAGTGGSVSGTVTGSVAGEVIYLDANNNSKLDTTELSTTTSSTGSYSFSNVPAGAYILRQILPSGYTQSTPASNGGIHITVTSTAKLTNENFTDKPPAVTHTKLTGTTIGTTGSYNNSGNTIAKAIDGSTSTLLRRPSRQRQLGRPRSGLGEIDQPNRLRPAKRVRVTNDRRPDPDQHFSRLQQRRDDDLHDHRHAAERADDGDADVAGDGSLHPLPQPYRQPRRYQRVRGLELSLDRVDDLAEGTSPSVNPSAEPAGSLGGDRSLFLSIRRDTSPDHRGRLRRSRVKFAACVRPWRRGLESRSVLMKPLRLLVITPAATRTARQFRWRTPCDILKVIRISTFRS